MKKSPKPVMATQHDDHVWLTVAGKAWAIEAIGSAGGDPILYLWRGYWPHLERIIVVPNDIDWDAYCAAAVAMLREQYGERV